MKKSAIFGKLYEINASVLCNRKQVTIDMNIDKKAQFCIW